MVVLPVPPLPARAIVYGILEEFLSVNKGSKVQGYVDVTLANFSTLTGFLSESKIQQPGWT
jgi:hypothetical protein